MLIYVMCACIHSYIYNDVRRFTPCLADVVVGLGRSVSFGWLSCGDGGFCGGGCEIAVSYTYYRAL